MADEQNGAEMAEQEPNEDQAAMANQADDAMSNANDDSAGEVEQLRAALKKANAEAARNRHKLADYEKAEQERKDAELSETERLKKQLAEAKEQQNVLIAKNTETQIRAAVERTAATMRFHDPADAYALADLSVVTMDEDGKISGVNDALKALAKAKPHLVRTEQPANLNAGDGAPTNGSHAWYEQRGLTKEEQAARLGINPKYLT